MRADAEAAAEAAAEATAAEATAPEATAGEPPDDEQARVEKLIKKRKLYRQTTGTMLPWFPHDNDPELLRELLHEAGDPRWIFHGTPAGAAGIHGCLEAGASVVMLCFDEHHRTHVRKCMLQRSVETLVAGTSLVFKDEALQTRSVDLQLAKAASADEAAVPKEEPKPKELKPKKKARPASNKAAKSKAPTTSSSSAASSSSDDGSSSSPSETKAKTKIDRYRT